MTAAILSALGGFAPWIVGIFGALAAFVAMKAKSKAEGKQVAAETIAKDREAIAAAEINKANAANEKQTESVRNANEATSQVNRTPIDVVNSELRDKWTRD